MQSAHRVLNASITVHDKSPDSVALLKEALGGLKQFDPIIEEWLCSPEVQYLCMCLDGAVPPKAFTMGATDEVDLLTRVLWDAANLMPVDALSTATLAGVSRSIAIKLPLVWDLIVAEALSGRGGAH